MTGSQQLRTTKLARMNKWEDYLIYKEKETIQKTYPKKRGNVSFISQDGQRLGINQ
jgi:hypothetical protein